MSELLTPDVLLISAYRDLLFLELEKLCDSWYRMINFRSLLLDPTYVELWSFITIYPIQYYNYKNIRPSLRPISLANFALI